jgi:hypothetical protein
VSASTTARRSEVPDYDEVEFHMVDGRTFKVTRKIGKGREFLTEPFEQNWINIDANTRIRTDKVIAMTLVEGDGGVLG